MYNKKRLLAVWAATLGLITPLVPARTKNPSFSKTSVSDSAKYHAFATPLPRSERTLHALDRLTFGPRQGDVDQIEKIGVKKWLALQLHPEKLPENPELKAALQPLDTLRLNIHQTFTRYPQPGSVAAIARGAEPLPSDP